MPDAVTRGTEATQMQFNALTGSGPIRDSEFVFKPRKIVLLLW